MVFVMLLGLLMSVLAGGLAMSSHAEAQGAGAYARSAGVSYSAESLLHEVEAAAIQTADWQDLPVTWLVGDAGGSVLRADRTAALNRSLGSQLPAGADTPRWRQVAWRQDQDGEGGAWVRDDPGDGDADPARDTNGRMTWRVEWTTSRAQRVFEMTLQRRRTPTGDWTVTRVAWRELS